MKNFRNQLIGAFSSKGTAGHRRSLFFSIAFTYFTLCLLLCVFSSFHLRSSSSAIRSELYQIGQEAADSAADDAADQIDDYVQLCNIIASSTNIRNLYNSLSADAALSLSDPAYQNLRSDLLSAQANSQDVYLNTVGVYYPSNAAVVTTLFAYDSTLMPYFLNLYDLSSDFFLNLPQAKCGASIGDDGSCWIIRKVYREGHVYAYIFVNFDFSDTYRNMLSDGDILCVEYGGVVRYLTGTDLSSSVVTAAAAGVPAGQVISLDGHSYFCGSSSEKDSGISITVLTNADSSIAQYRTFYFQGIFLLILGVLVMIILSIIYTNRIYLPTRNLLQNAAGLDSGASFAKSLDSMNTYVQQLKEDVDDYRRDRTDNAYLIYGNKLEQLIASSPVLQWKDLAAFMNEIGLEKSPLFTFTAFNCDTRNSNFFSDTPSDTLEAKGEPLFFFTVNNVLSELLGDSPKSRILKADGFYILLTQFQADTDIEKVSSALQQLTEFFSAHFDTLIISNSPQVITTVETFTRAMKKAPSELDNALFWQRKLQAGKPVRSEDMPSPYIKKVQTLLSTLELGNYRNAYEQMDELLELLYTESSNYRYCIFRIYGLLSIVIESLKSRSSAAIPDVNIADYEARLYDTDSIEDLKVEVKSIIDELITLSDVNTDGTPAIVQEMKQYIDKNYMNHDISLTSLSADFSLSESAISKLFRRDLNTSVLEYIQRLRVNKAKELLLTMSVKDTAKAIGLWDTQALIRLFKKYEGITPGQYKELHSAEVEK